MAKIKTYKRLSVISIIMIILTTCNFLMCLNFSVKRFNQIDGTKSRQYFFTIQNQISQDQEVSVDGVDYAIVLLDGKVSKSTISGYVPDQIIELKFLAGIDGTKENSSIYFVAPLLKNNTQIGTLILLIDSNLVRAGISGNIAWIVIYSLLFMVNILLILYTVLIIKKNISTPLALISKIAKKMARGDYNERLLYDYNDEIGGLCHDLEILRDDLLSSYHRECELKRNEKFLLACISHDLKTPLAIIAGTAESLKDNLVMPSHAAGTILSKTKMLNKLIDDILEQTKTELSEFSINLTECYAKDFFEKELKELQSEVKKKGLAFIIYPCPDCILNIDKQRIYQVMQNLIDNAIKYTPKGGSITVNFEIKDNSLSVSIKDTGVGIPAQDLPFIFDKFYRGEKARNSQIQGSGLGLTIAKYIIEKHGGNLECDTLLCKGTEMRFSLSLAK